MCAGWLTESHEETRLEFGELLGDVCIRALRSGAHTGVFRLWGGVLTFWGRASLRAEAPGTRSVSTL